MSRSIILWASSLLLVFAMLLGLGIAWHTWSAPSFYSTYTGFSGDACQHPVIEVTPTQVVMSQNETRSIELLLGNKGRSPCRVIVRVDAPQFRVDPPSYDPLTLSAGETRAKVSWILTAQLLGDFKVNVRAALDSVTVGVRVTNVFGLPADLAALAAWVGGVMGASGLTLRCVYDWYKSRRKRRRGVG